MSKDLNCQFFTPSSITAFGSNYPKNYTQQNSIQRPNTLYKITKVAGELLYDYYFSKFGSGTRRVRFPSLISYITLAGGGITDYAVDIYFEALENKSYNYFVRPGTKNKMTFSLSCFLSI